MKHMWLLAILLSFALLFCSCDFISDEALSDALNELVDQLEDQETADTDPLPETQEETPEEPILPLIEENEEEDLPDVNEDIFDPASEIDVDEGDEPEEYIDPSESLTDLPESEETLDEFGTYTSKDDVALYIHLYNKLPDNYITKDEAEDLGWHKDRLEDHAPGKSIGGDYFGNNEGLLPKKKGRRYTECDIDAQGKKSRGAKRIVFSNDGLIYYTDDHYESFELLYGDEAA